MDPQAAREVLPHRSLDGDYASVRLGRDRAGDEVGGDEPPAAGDVIAVPFTVGLEQDEGARRDRVVAGLAGLGEADAAIAELRRHDRFDGDRGRVDLQQEAQILAGVGRQDCLEVRLNLRGHGAAVADLAIEEVDGEEACAAQVIAEGRALPAPEEGDVAANELLGTGLALDEEAEAAVPPCVL